MATHIGDRGTAETDMHPQGFVRVGGERLSARSDRGAIAAGADIVVVSGDNSGLVVRMVEPGQTPSLPNHGREVYASFGAKVAAEGKREETAQERANVARGRYGLVLGAILGAIAAGLAAYFLWDTVRDQAVAAGVVAAGAVWGVCVFRALDAVLCQLDSGYGKYATASAVLALAGTGLGAVIGIPALGLFGGLAAAVGFTLVFGALVPIAVLLTGGGE